MNRNEIGRESVEWIHQNRDQWQALAKTLMNLLDN
jgi:hypothetical protein